MLLNRLLAGTALISAIIMSPVMATPSDKTALFGESYEKANPVVAGVSQVVYYRADNTQPAPGGANIYLDGHYHTSLMPGGFTSFCVRPGQHTLGGYVQDSPQYAGKNGERFTAALKGGHTYFLRIDEQQKRSDPPVAVTADEAGREATTLRRQAHVLPRTAGVVVPCVYDRNQVQPVSHYLFKSSDLFADDQFAPHISEQGRDALNNFVVSLHVQYLQPQNVTIRIWRPAGDDIVQSGERAAAIRRELMMSAIPKDVIAIDMAQCSDACTPGEQDIDILLN
jgi:OOP family OmpA-OmpF porin